MGFFDERGNINDQITLAANSFNAVRREIYSCDRQRLEKNSRCANVVYDLATTNLSQQRAT